jgi:hypothetical protein
MDVRLARPISGKARLQVTGTNLLHARHQEYPGGDFIPRRIMAGLDLAI